MRTDPNTVLDFYARPGRLTSPGRHAKLLDELPHDLADLVAVGQGRLIHEAVAPAYGVTLSDERRRTVHIRSIERLLDELVAEDDLPLTTARTPDARTAGNCRHFTVLLVTMLRHQGVPARARCGFGDYFGTGWHEDHWVCEYFDADAERWILVDAQLDDRQRELFGVDFDPLDVPRDRFLVAGDAWERCRSGRADPAKFGLSMLNEGGDWWIAGNLIHDVAALANVEMLPWDVWGAMPAPGEPIEDHLVAFFDRLAGLTQQPDEELLAAYRDDDRLTVPTIVHNAVLNRDEAVT